MSVQRRRPGTSPVVESQPIGQTRHVRSHVIRDFLGIKIPAGFKNNKLPTRSHDMKRRFIEHIIYLENAWTNMYTHTDDFLRLVRQKKTRARHVGKNCETCFPTLPLVDHSGVGPQGSMPKCVTWKHTVAQSISSLSCIAWFYLSLCNKRQCRRRDHQSWIGQHAKIFLGVYV